MTDKPVANPSVVLREEFDDYALLYNPDSVEVYCLNPVGVKIWKQFDGQHTVDDILKDLQTSVNNVPGEACEHLKEFIADLAKRGLISSQTAQGA